ncbi:hypothetical protein HDU96_004472 [Phlyctochytrium bullatum]|nr:hypothetical protein HDU96_004472 [Phlyctochytrium bullatum]
MHFRSLPTHQDKDLDLVLVPVPSDQVEHHLQLSPIRRRRRKPERDLRTAPPRGRKPHRVEESEPSDASAAETPTPDDSGSNPSATDFGDPEHDETPTSSPSDDDADDELEPSGSSAVSDDDYDSDASPDSVELPPAVGQPDTRRREAQRGSREGGGRRKRRERREVPEAYHGAFYMKGNPMPDEVCAIAGAVWNEEAQAFDLPVYGPGVWTWDPTFLGRLVHRLAVLTRLHYRIRFIDNDSDDSDDSDDSGDVEHSGGDEEALEEAVEAEETDWAGMATAEEYSVEVGEGDEGEEDEDGDETDAAGMATADEYADFATTSFGDDEQAEAIRPAEQIEEAGTPPPTAPALSSFPPLSPLPATPPLPIAHPHDPPLPATPPATPSATPPTSHPLSTSATDRMNRLLMGELEHRRMHMGVAVEVVEEMMVEMVPVEGWSGSEEGEGVPLMFEELGGDEGVWGGKGEQEGKVVMIGAAIPPVDEAAPREQAAVKAGIPLVEENATEKELPSNPRPATPPPAKKPEEPPASAETTRHTTQHATCFLIEDATGMIPEAVLKVTTSVAPVPPPTSIGTIPPATSTADLPTAPSYLLNTPPPLPLLLPTPLVNTLVAPSVATSAMIVHATLSTPHVGFASLVGAHDPGRNGKPRREAAHGDGVAEIDLGQSRGEGLVGALNETRAAGVVQRGVELGALHAEQNAAEARDERREERTTPAGSPPVASGDTRRVAGSVEAKEQGGMEDVGLGIGTLASAMETEAPSPLLKSRSEAELHAGIPPMPNRFAEKSSPPTPPTPRLGAPTVPGPAQSDQMEELRLPAGALASLSSVDTASESSESGKADAWFGAAIPSETEDTRLAPGPCAGPTVAGPTQSDQPEEFFLPAPADGEAMEGPSIEPGHGSLLDKPLVHSPEQLEAEVECGHGSLLDEALVHSPEQLEAEVPAPVWVADSPDVEVATTPPLEATVETTQRTPWSHRRHRRPPTAVITAVVFPRRRVVDGRFVPVIKRRHQSWTQWVTSFWCPASPPSPSLAGLDLPPLPTKLPSVRQRRLRQPARLSALDPRQWVRETEVPTWGCRFEAVPTGDADVFWRRSWLAGVRVLDYEFLRIVRGDGTRTEVYEGAYLERVGRGWSWWEKGRETGQVGVSGFTHLGGTQLVAVRRG